MLGCSKASEIRETKTRISHIAAFKRGDDVFDTKTLNLADVSSSSPFAINSLLGEVVANSREQVYFRQQILAWLPVYQTDNLSCIKVAHILLQVEGLCISWNSVETHRMTFHVAINTTLNPDENTIGATIGYNVCVANNNLRYNLRLPWRKKKRKKRNLSQFITRIASHPRNKPKKSRGKNLIIVPL